MRESRLKYTGPFYHSDPPGTGNPNQGEVPEGASPDGLPATITIDGQEYTPDQLDDAIGVIEAQKREADAQFTRQTQAIAQKRREVEEMEERARALLERAEQQFDSTDYSSDEPEDSMSKRLRGIEESTQKLIRTQEEAAHRQAEAAAIQERERAFQEALNSLNGKPYINDNAKAELRQYMDQIGLLPQHVIVAYNARYGPQIGEQKGLHMAMSKGPLAGPPLMGSGGQSISPGFTTPQEIPGATVPIERKSWDDLKYEAMNDPNKPNF
jgi:hypothetical protein